MRVLIGSATLVSLLACGSPIGPIPGDLVVRATPPVLELANHSSAAIYTFTIDRNVAAYTEWGPCTNPSTCAFITAGGTRSLAYTQIDGYSSASREAIVYWWHLVPDGIDGFQPDSVRAVVIGL